MQFTFRVKRKAAYERGTIVFGKILSGTIDKDKDVLVSVGKNEYKAHIDSIIDKPDGGYVQSCSKGNNVSLYLSGIEEQLIKPRITVVRNYSVEKVNSNIDKKQNQSKKEHSKNEKIAESTLPKRNLQLQIKNEKYSSVEKDFIQDVLVCIKETGKLAPTELYVLDKLRIAYNLSEERSRQLILGTIKKYNAKKNELLYKDAVSACLLDCGYLTTTERYLLEKLRIALNISEQKAYSLEKDSDWDIL